MKKLPSEFSRLIKNVSQTREEWSKSIQTQVLWRRNLPECQKRIFHSLQAEHSPVFPTTTIMIALPVRD